MEAQAAKKSNSWRWMIIFSRFFWTFISLGSFKSMGVFLPHFVETFSTSTAAVGLVGTAIVSIGGIIGPIVSLLMTVLSPRKLTIVGGIIAASALILASFSSSITELGIWIALSSVGLSFVQVSTVRPLMDYFPQDFAFANGFTLAGGTLGMMVLPPVMEFLISVYGWRSTLRLMGAFSLHYVVCGALLRPLKRKQNHDKYRLVSDQCDDESSPSSPSILTDGERSGKKTLCDSFLTVLRNIWQHAIERFNARILTEKTLMIYQLETLLCGVIFGSWHLFLIPQGVEQGYGNAPSAVLATFGGFGALVGRLSHGKIVDRGLVKASTLFASSCAVFGVSCLLDTIAVSSYAALASIATVSGLAIGIIYPLTFVLVRESTRDELHVSAIGLLYLSQSSGQILGGFAGGWLHDDSGGYEIVFIMMGVIAIIMAAIAVAMQYLEGCCKAKK